MNRRAFLEKSFWSLTGFGLLSGVYITQVEPFWLEFVKVKMPVKNLPKHLIGKRLMQISDIHICKRFDHQFIIDAFHRASLYKPDFVVYTGDYVSTYKDEVPFEKLNETLQNCVKGKLATLGVLGNHDYGMNWSQNHVADQIAEMLNDNGITTLRNRQIEIEGLNFLGFDDYWGPNFDAVKAMNGYDNSQASIALCHNPDVCDLDIWNNYDGWILSGHTHGGQCKPPFLPPPMLPVKNRNYTGGQFDLSNGRTLYINRALGNLWQVRFNVRPEITVFELSKA